MEHTFDIPLGPTMRERVVNMLGLHLRRAVPDADLCEGMLEALLSTLSETAGAYPTQRTVPVTIRTSEVGVEVEMEHGLIRDTWMCTV